MARVGKVGKTINLVVKFFDNGNLFNPFTVEDVEIFADAIGGVPIATITPIMTSLGVFEASYAIPLNLTPGTYYDEWTWTPFMGDSSNAQRYDFSVLGAATVEEAPAPIVTKVPGKPKVSSSRNAVGYWGRNIQKRVDIEETPEKIRALLQDKLNARGKTAFLWQQVTEDTPDVLACSCVKDTTDKADVACLSCYGVKLIPGYKRFLHDTPFLASVSPNISLTNVTLDTNIKPHRLLLSDSQLSGTITSFPIPYDNILNNNWEFRVDAINIVETNQILASFSTDGITFHPIDEINDVGKKPVGLGNLYLRVSMARASTTDRSPEFQIIRVRHATDSRPFIKLLRPQVGENPALFNYGRRVEQLAERFWTAPLDFFDRRIPRDTPAARILENAFYQRVDGINSDARYAVSKLYYNEEFGAFTHQSFQTRRTQPEEFYNRLVF